MVQKSGLIKIDFSSKPNKEKPYTIVIPPPNVTGSTYGTYA